MIIVDRENCIGCGICEENCLVEAIKVINEKAAVNENCCYCKTCIKNCTANCKLKEVSRYTESRPEQVSLFRQSALDHGHFLDSSNPFFERDLSKCILCGICIRTCNEINGVKSLDFLHCSDRAIVGPTGTDLILESTCESCGECVVRCPTAALSFKKRKAPEQEIKSICSYCGVGCGVYLGVRGNEVVSVRGDKENIVNEGTLCVKGRFGFEFINHKDRLKYPLIKRNDEFEEVTWDEALSFIAEKIKITISKNGPHSLAGLSSARCTNEDNYLFMKLLRTLGTNNIDHCARL